VADRLLRRPTTVLSSCLILAAGMALGWHLARGASGRRALAAPAPALPADFTDVAERSTPAVVNISALQVFRSERSPFSSDPFFRQFFGPERPFRIPQEERKLSLGSGVVISRDGLIVTNNHVIDQAREIAITGPDRRRDRGTLVGTDPVTDIAVIRVEEHALTPLPWGDSSRARVGEYVLAVGNPFRFNQTVTMGIISAIGRSNVGIVDYEDFIQTDAAINPGNSGGALVNTKGELIGINTAIYSETGGYQGIGFAVPANLARQVVDDIVAHGHVRRGFVGITGLRDLDEESARELGLKEAEGVVVVEMLRGSPAARAGLRPGDIVTGVDGRPVSDSAQLRNELASVKVGSLLKLTVMRRGERMEISIRIAEDSSGA
jgi:Do/DeqQ family serine protease